jgi:endoglucanase
MPLPKTRDRALWVLGASFLAMSCAAAQKPDAQSDVQDSGGDAASDAASDSAPPPDGGTSGGGDPSFVGEPPGDVFQPGAEEKGPWPRVVALGVVSPSVVRLVVRTGRIVPAKQTPYVAEGSDVVRTEGRNTMLYRGSALVGYLVGLDKKTLFMPSTVEQVPITVSAFQKTTAFALSSADDANFATPVAPTAVHLKSRPHVTQTGPWAFNAAHDHVFYLVLPKPLSAGKSYSVALNGVSLAAPVPALAYAPERAPSDAVHVSQLGFHPDDPVKNAFLATWMGTGAGLAYSPGLELTVRNVDTNEVAFRSAFELAMPATQKEDAYRNHNGTDVLRASFAGLKTPGVYRACAQGIGCSLPFQINEGLWQRAFRVSAKGFYHHRRSVPLGPPHSTFVRPTNLDPRAGKPIYQTTATLMDTGNGLNGAAGMFEPLVAGKTDTVCNECWGGLMDAGDWDSRIQHLIVTLRMLELAELAPTYFKGLDLNIPESTNALPDIVDEALFNLDHYRRMQMSDGGVRGGVESAEHPNFGEASWQESQMTFVYAPDIWSTYHYAATAARAAEYLSTLDAEASKTYRASAESAMAWAEARLPATPRFEVRDARNLAAIALYRLTNDAKYHQVFLATTVFKSVSAEMWIWEKQDQREACWLYLDTSRSVDAATKTSARAALLREADLLVKRSGETAYGWARNEWAPVGWGALGTPNAASLIRAHRLTGDAKYLETTLRTTEYGAGANPQNLVFTTGLGLHRVRLPLHCDALSTGAESPSGITIFGPLDLEKFPTDPFLGPLKPFVTPALESWPTTEALFDMSMFATTMEYVVNGPMIESAYAWGYLAALRAGLR